MAVWGRGCQAEGIAQAKAPGGNCRRPGWGRGAEDAGGQIGRALRGLWTSSSVLGKSLVRTPMPSTGPASPGLVVWVLSPGSLPAQGLKA